MQNMTDGETVRDSNPARYLAGGRWDREKHSRFLFLSRSIFVGVSARRGKIARKSDWTTNAWILDEKVYTLGRQKRLILLKEQGVSSIGGIQGEFECIEFTHDARQNLFIRLIQFFEVTNNGLRK